MEMCQKSLQMLLGAIIYMEMEISEWKWFFLDTEYES